MKGVVAGLLMMGAVWVGLGVPPLSQSVTISWYSQGWISLWVHPDLFLGVADRSSFNPEDKSFRPLEALGNPVVVAGNLPQGLVLTIRAVDWQVPPGFPEPVPEGFLEDFQWRVSGGNFQPLSLEETVVWQSSGPKVAQLSVDYRYQLEITDVPGDYSVTILYTASAP
jgi:hypothetical protein